VIFKSVGEGRPYPDHGLGPAQWSSYAPRQIRLSELITTKRTLDLEALLDEQSTFYGDLFAHVVQWRSDLYLEDGLHRALRTALHGRPVLHARVLDLDDPAVVAALGTAVAGGGRR
jgi:Arc/MetJ family transcription regulator